MTERSFLRWGGASAVLGGALALIGNGLHPRFGDLDSAVEYQRIARSGSWTTVHFVILVAVILVTVGFVAIARDAGNAPDAAWARAGGVFATVGGAVGVVYTLVDGFAFRQLARGFSSSGQEFVSAYWGAQAVDWIQNYLFAGFAFLFLGVTPLLLGLSQRARVKWLGVAGGAVTAAAGLMEFFDANQTADDILFAIGSVVVTIWALVAGVGLWRSNAPEAVAATT